MLVYRVAVTYLPILEPAPRGRQEARGAGIVSRFCADVRAVDCGGDAAGVCCHGQARRSLASTRPATQPPPAATTTIVGQPAGLWQGRGHARANWSTCTSRSLRPSQARRDGGDVGWLRDLPPSHTRPDDRPDHAGRATPTASRPSQDDAAVDPRVQVLPPDRGREGRASTCPASRARITGSA